MQGKRQPGGLISTQRGERKYTLDMCERQRLRNKQKEGPLHGESQSWDKAEAQRLGG